MKEVDTITLNVKKVMYSWSHSNLKEEFSYYENITVLNLAQAPIPLAGAADCLVDEEVRCGRRKKVGSTRL